jgi:hypothetical protein
MAFTFDKSPKVNRPFIKSDHPKSNIEEDSSDRLCFTLDESSTVKKVDESVTARSSAEKSVLLSSLLVASLFIVVSECNLQPHTIGARLCERQ